MAVAKVGVSMRERRSKSSKDGIDPILDKILHENGFEFRLDKHKKFFECLNDNGEVQKIKFDDLSFEKFMSLDYSNM